MTVGGFATSVLIAGPLDEDALRSSVDEARRKLPGKHADLALLFISPPLIPALREILEIVQVHGRATHLLGCTTLGVIGQSEEIEKGAALSILFLSLPGASLKTCRIDPRDLDQADQPAWWNAHTQVGPRESRGWLIFGDPQSVDTERWLQQWNQAFPAVPTLGGLGGATPTTDNTHLFIDQHVYTDGLVGISLSGPVRLEAIVSQGCTPIGNPWTITSADRHYIRRIGNLPALTVLQDTFNALPDDEKARANGNIFVGLAVDEYLEEHRRGDFLVRNLLGADPNQGVVAVGARVRVGQTLQFQFRDADAATEDFAALLEVTRQRLATEQILAACLCSCAGRGHGLFGERHHDTRLVHQALGSDLPHAGFFGNGEIGPIGPRNHLHGYTASLALFVADSPLHPPPTPPAPKGT